MSFSQTVKEELAEVIPSARHCRLAELAALIHFGCTFSQSGDALSIQAENETISRKCFTLLQKTFNINTVMERTDADRLLQALHLYDSDHHVLPPDSPVHPLLVKGSCCKRAYLRGAFLCIGTMSDPEKSYQLEFVCAHENQALQLQELMREFAIETRITRRKNHYVVYLKESSGLVDLLNVMGAYVSLMNLENLRIVKDMRNSINRRVNCETANITKTVYAAAQQIEDIHLIEERIGLDSLPKNLQEMAGVRLEHPDDSLQTLGSYLDPPVGKSGVNHRLRKLSEIAESMRL